MPTSSARASDGDRPASCASQKPAVKTDAAQSHAPSQTVHFVCPRIVPSPPREVSIALGRSPDALARRTLDFSHARESQSIGPSSDAGGSVLSPMPPSASLDGKGAAHAMPPVLSIGSGSNTAPGGDVLYSSRLGGALCRRSSALMAASCTSGCAAATLRSARCVCGETERGADVL